MIKNAKAILITSAIVIAAFTDFILFAHFSEQQENERLGVEFVKEGEAPVTDVGWTEDKKTFFYKGRVGKNALELLKVYADVEQDRSGLVVSIKGRASDNAKREYWAFYVNGKMAQVGPADYVTKNNDVIEWKIEKY